MVKIRGIRGKRGWAIIGEGAQARRVDMRNPHSKLPSGFEFRRQPARTFKTRKGQTVKIPAKGKWVMTAALKNQLNPAFKRRMKGKK
ncbi:MAG: hypothetical protein OIF34_05850 [Porticoccaceae bacterium]|nr:hypothetical protein [Porticoccaceae bacterium]